LDQYFKGEESVNESGFKAWLKKNYSDATVSTKFFEARKLAEAYGDLDEHFEKDRLQSIADSLKYAPADRDGGKPNPSKLELSKDLLRDLRNYRTTVNYYRWFREGRSRVARNGDLGLPADEVSQEESTYSELRVTPTPINLILFGPPGTGKTYATVSHAVRLCDGLADDDPLLHSIDRREELKRRYDELVEALRIDFVTFHQSYSYEEFVEGLRPVQAGPETTSGENGASGFSLIPTEGVFRRIASRAATSKGGGGHYTIGDRQVFKMSIGEAANAEDDYLFEEAIAGGHTLLGYDDIDWSDPKFEDRDAFIEACKAYDKKNRANNRPAPTAQTGRVQCPFTFRNLIKRGDLIVVSKGNSRFRAIGEITDDYEYAPRESGIYCQKRAVRWLWMDKAGAPVEDIYGKIFSQRAVYLLTRDDIRVRALETYINSQLQVTGSTRPEPYVLIIDEINRGNTSRIFGELITLIEPDKRAGQANAVEVRLPYSKSPFSVPSNLHMVATMNTADRSIALLDTALRRRFLFREIAPDSALLPESVDGVPLRAMLESINDRIEYLIDREHRIGHAFFMGCNSRTEIDAVMRDKVIPLLQEYFFEDWSRAAAVLNERPGKGGAFLDCRRLANPIEPDDETRDSWCVRSVFAPDAYVRLVGESMSTAMTNSASESQT
jgi:5-methylcytosine-specific restriction protein B